MQSAIHILNLPVVYTPLWQTPFTVNELSLFFNVPPTFSRCFLQLLNEKWRYEQGNFLEMRAAAAALCEPKLLKRKEHAKETLPTLDKITTSISGATGRTSERNEF
jgi:hypothetical protein